MYRRRSAEAPASSKSKTAIGYAIARKRAEVPGSAGRGRRLPTVSTRASPRSNRQPRKGYSKHCVQRVSNWRRRMTRGAGRQGKRTDSLNGGAAKRSVALADVSDLKLSSEGTVSRRRRRRSWGVSGIAGVPGCVGCSEGMPTGAADSAGKPSAAPPSRRAHRCLPQLQMNLMDMIDSPRRSWGAQRLEEREDLGLLRFAQTIEGANRSRGLSRV